MDYTEITEQIKYYIKKYRYIVIAVLCGIFLMSLPSRQEAPKQAVVQKEIQEINTPGILEKQLEELLGQLAGAGRVKVLLTQSQGEQILYQTNSSESIDDDTSNIRRDTVTVTDADHSQKGLVSQIIPPKYLGAVVLCQGGDRADVRLAIVEAISSATGLTSNKITVLKMK